MIIDRHNYEECFILYWDDELSASQRQAVENFVKENADLQGEFKVLGETRFTPDNKVQFEEKEFLLNNSFINITNYEEQLLDYIDDELKDNERKEVEKFAAANSNIKKELALLQKTKLQPEAIVFPDRSSLYRREEKVRVISMAWFRVAVAATIILIAGFATIRLINTNKNGDNNEIANVTPKTTTTPSTVDPSNQPVDPKQNIAGTEKTSGPSTLPQDKQGLTADDEKKLAANIASAKNDKNKNNLPKEGNRINQQVADPGTMPEDPIAYDFTPLSKDKTKAQASDLEKTNELFDKSFVTNTSRITSDDIDIPIEASKEKGGLKQFLRKTTRVFERRTNIQTTTEDNKLLLGAFAVSLK